jgi:hypothetical protein
MNWDRKTEKYKQWKEAHEPKCNINFKGTSNSMEAFGAKNMWCRSLEKHNLRYTIYIGDGDSSSYKGICEAKPYGDDIKIEKSDCTGHVQKRMGTALRELIASCKKQIVIPTPEGCKGRTGITGRNGLTGKVINQMQNYYGMAIRSNIGNKDRMTGNQSNLWPFLKRPSVLPRR